MVVMKRETTNRIRFVLEEILPPALRDSSLFLRIARMAWGRHIDDLTNFRIRATSLTAAEYEALYRRHPRVHSETDNSLACVRQAARDLIGTSVCDVGCGTGALLRHFLEKRRDIDRLIGVDFVLDHASSIPGIQFVAARVESLPFADREFDTVVCTHVLEHILDYRAAISELRRITRRRLILIVPQEREYLYTFNPHFNFFPYPHSLLRAMHPSPAKHDCFNVGRDIYYREDYDHT